MNVNNKIPLSKNIISRHWLLEEIIYQKDNRQVWKCHKNNSKENKYVIKLHFPTKRNDLLNFKTEVNLLLDSTSSYILPIVDYKLDPFLHNGDFIQYMISPFYKSNLAENNIGLRNPFLAIFFFRYLIEGIMYLETKLIVHRDLKPENIFINQNNLPIIGDFGRAMKVKRKNRLGLLSKKEDIYNLAKILYYLLTGIRLIKFVNYKDKYSRKRSIVLSPKNFHKCGFKGFDILFNLMLDMTQSKVTARPSLEILDSKLVRILELNRSFQRKMNCYCFRRYIT